MNIQIIRELLKNLGIEDVLKKGIDELIKTIKKGTDVILDIETLKIAWSYEEKNTEKYSFSQAVAWTKVNMPNGIKMAAIYKEEKPQYIKLHLCFLDEENNPYLDGIYPHLAVKTITLDNELLNNFGSKNLIVLK